MNTKNKNELMKKFILVNKVFISLQTIFFMLSIIFNFTLDDDAVFLTIFTHVGVFVIFNVIVESIIEYGYLRKKFAKICDETHYLRHFQLKKRMYKTAKQKQDTISSTLILQESIKFLIVILNISSMIFMVSFE